MQAGAYARLNVRVRKLAGEGVRRLPAGAVARHENGGLDRKQRVHRGLDSRLHRGAREVHPADEGVDLLYVAPEWLQLESTTSPFPCT